MPRLRFRPGVRFGEPLDFSRYYGMESNPLVLRAVTDEIMYALMELAGQEYVDIYAADAKAKAKASASRRLSRHRPAEKPPERQAS
jgi:1-acyl-sn-glycerol-3-phosphate acyltransferase